MKKGLLKTLGVSLLVSAVIVNAQIPALAASKGKDVTTGRTRQNVQTGVISYNSISSELRYASEVELSGTVVIDGPELVLKVDGVDVTSSAVIKKVADKTWTYSYTAALNGRLGHVAFNIEAYTVYPKGSPAGGVHTSAPSVSQTVHVPYVVGFEYTNLTWDAYDRVSNEFTLSYNLVKVWDDGYREVVEQRAVGAVKGTDTYEITASDVTYNNGALGSAGVVVPPVKVVDFSVSDEVFSNYDSVSNTFLLSFTLLKQLSNGSTASEDLTFTVEAGREFEYTAEDDSLPGDVFSKTFRFSPPEANIETPSLQITNVAVFINNVQELANNGDRNNYKVQYTVIVTLSSGSEYSFEGNEVTIPNNSGNNNSSKFVQSTFVIEGVNYTVGYTVTVS